MFPHLEGGLLGVPLLDGLHDRGVLGRGSLGGDLRPVRGLVETVEIENVDIGAPETVDDPFFEVGVPGGPRDPKVELFVDLGEILL